MPAAPMIEADWRQAVRDRGPFGVLTDPAVWEAAGGWPTDAPGPGPAWVTPVTSLEEEALETLARSLKPLSRGLCLAAVGGGRVLDAGKYLAWRLHRPFLLVPSSVASNAAFTRAVAVRRRGAPQGVRVPVAPEAVVVDLELIGRAPEAVNRAGVGDMLLLATAPEDWDRSVRAGRAPANGEVRQAVAGIWERLEAALRGPSVATWMRPLLAACRAHAALAEEHPELPLGFGSEHLLAWTLEEVAGRELIHGGSVALGALVASRLQGGDTGRLLDLVRRTAVPWRPVEDLGVGWQEVAQALRQVRAYNAAHRRIYTVLDEVELNEHAIGRCLSELKAWAMGV